MTRPSRLALALAALVAPVVLAAPAARADEAPKPYAVGDLVDPVVFEDQHGVEHLLDESVRLVLFSRDMDASDLIAAALEEDGAARLERRGAVFVADIHRMPALVTRLFALPSLRRRPYPMWLDRDGTKTARFPGEAKRATLIGLRALRITRIDHVDSADAVRAALDAVSD